MACVDESLSGRSAFSRPRPATDHGRRLIGAKSMARGAIEPARGGVNNLFLLQRRCLRLRRFVLKFFDDLAVLALDLSILHVRSSTFLEVPHLLGAGVAAPEANT